MSDQYTYSREELGAMLKKMQIISDSFYGAAVMVGNHAFIEFCGLMNEYIKMCMKALESGSDFTQASIHSGRPLFPMQDYNAEYLGEKFGCIFGPTFGGDEKLVAVFVREAFGIEMVTEKGNPG